MKLEAFVPQKSVLVIIGYYYKYYDTLNLKILGKYYKYIKFISF